MKYASLLLIVLCLSGCATAGRVALVDWDLRSPAQIQAASHEVLKPAVPVEPDVVPPEPADVGVMAKLFDVLKVIEGRVRVLSIEWVK